MLDSLDSAVQPWERLPQEPSKAHAAFLTYRDMPPKHEDAQEQRSLTNVARKYNVDRSLCARWSALYSWVQRAAAWDQAQAQARQEAHFTAIREMSKRQAEDAERTQRALAILTHAVNRKFARGGEQALEDLAALSWDKLFTLVTTAQHALAKIATLERLARGADTAQIGIREIDTLGLYDAILADPTTAALASDLVARLADPAGVGAGDAAPLDAPSE